MTQNDVELLRLYADDRSEEAFSELVRRHIDVVYAAALRQMDGDAHLAEDVTQRVFSDLAGKASSLTKHTSLVGWLYASTRFCSLTIRRTEQRRREREQEAYMMEPVDRPAAPAPDWDRLSGVLDETMSELDDDDREAVLLRFFKGCSLKEVGENLGVSDNTARMRVDRALDKLRALLSNRGIASTAAALAVLFDTYAAPSAPGKLATRVAKAAVRGGVAAGTLGFWAARNGAKILFATGAVTALIVAWIMIFPPAPKTVPSTTIPTTNAPVPVVAPEVKATESAASPKVEAAIEAATAGSARLVLKLTDARNGKPVTGAKVVYLGWSGERFHGRKEFTVSNAGVCEVAYPPDTTKLELNTQRERYADTRIRFTTEAGGKIPAEFVVRLDAAAWIGGVVLDPDGQPVAGATVSWNHMPDLETDKLTVSHQFTYIETVSGKDGKWQIDRIADEMIPRIYGSARHSDYTESLDYRMLDTQTEQTLRDGKVTFYLGRSLAIGGDVKDAKGRAIEGAEILVGRVGSSSRRAKGLSDGTFVVKGCRPGAEVLTATAPGFASAALEVEISSNSPAYHFVLGSGRRLRFTVADPAGEPISGAKVVFDERHELSGNPAPQVSFRVKTEADGSAVWTNAPEGELRFIIAAEHFRRTNIMVAATGELEESIRLGRALVVTGLVKDEATGSPISSFRMATGAPAPEGSSHKIMDRSSVFQTGWKVFTKGQYEVVYEGSEIAGVSQSNMVMDVEADGYESYISRVIEAEEGAVRLDIALKRSPERRVTVLSPEGQPVAGAEVGFVRFLTQHHMGIGKLDTLEALGGSSVQTDAAGQFVLPQDENIREVIVSGPAGFAEAEPKVLKEKLSMTVLPWGRIEATCLSGGQPAANRVYLLQLAKAGASGYAGDLETNKFVSDAQGHFVIPRAPPGKRLLAHLISDGNEADAYWIHGRQTEVTVSPGEVKQVAFGESGYTVQGHIQWPESGRPTGCRLFIDVSTPLSVPKPTDEERNNPGFMAEYFSRPDVQKARKAQRRYIGVAEADGRFAVDDVPAGQYELSVLAHTIAPGQKDVIMRQTAKVTIPDGATRGKLNVGEIVLRASLVK